MRTGLFIRNSSNENELTVVEKTTGENHAVVATIYYHTPYLEVVDKLKELDIKPCFLMIGAREELYRDVPLEQTLGVARALEEHFNIPQSEWYIVTCSCNTHSRDMHQTLLRLFGRENRPKAFCVDGECEDYVIVPSAGIRPFLEQGLLPRERLDPPPRTVWF